MNIRKLFEEAILKAAPMPIQQLKNPGRNMAQKSGMQPSRLQPKPYMTPNGGTSQFWNNPTNAGSLNPGGEDGYDTDIAHLRGRFQSQQVSPVDMDAVPGNLSVGQHQSYYQGSAPFQNQPYNNVYHNVNPMPVDDMQYRRQIQPSYTSKPKWF